ncbi:MAG: mRNA-degrading endonuclease [Lewinella sp.]|nr:mRNA-degrading endonuclease [Lewinella sp.]
MARYIPQQKDIISLRMPVTGTASEKQRYLVVSATAYNRLGRCILCPVVEFGHGLRTEVKLPIGQRTAGLVVADQCRNLDWRLRWPRKHDQLTDNAVFMRVIETLHTLVQLVNS